MPVPTKYQLDRRAAALAAQIEIADDQLLDTKQTAKLLAMSEQRVELGRHYGYGPRYLKLSPRRIRYRKSDIRVWLEQRVYASTCEYETAGGRPRKVASDAAE